jgi:hypothetical protein
VGDGEMGRKQFKVQPSKIQNLGRGCEEYEECEECEECEE